MGAIIKIYEDFCEDSFAVLGIHSGLEDYALGYALNQELRIHLRRLKNDLDISPRISYPIFEWRDELYDRNWTLLTNRCRTEEKSGLNDLFPNEPSYSMHHLVPEYKDADYLLKVDEEGMESDILKSIKAIPEVIAAYTIEIDRLKSKPNLIF